MNYSDWLATLYFFSLLMTWAIGPKFIARIWSGNPEAKVEQVHIFTAVLISVVPIINAITFYYALVINCILWTCSTDKERYDTLNELIDNAIYKTEEGKKDKKLRQKDPRL